MAKTVVLLTAKWCPQCHGARQFWERLRQRLEFHYRELDIDSVEGQAMADRHNIQSVPATILDDRLWDGMLDETTVVHFLGNRPA